jgi:hopanoid biosynthesis associated protein HpnK
MARPDPARRLIVNADDFGLSSSVNRAVARAHREGILTSASLMVNEEGFAEAVALARENPRLGVGLHLTLVRGRASFPPARLPGLIRAGGRFAENPVRAGCRYFFQRALRASLEEEMAAQFEAFRKTGLILDHVNGHLHFHLHPVVFSILMERAADWGVKGVRLTRDDFWLNARLASGRWLYRVSHALIFTLLARSCRARLAQNRIRHSRTVLGLLQDGAVNQAYLERLLPRLPPGDSELYSHPSLDQFKHEFEALTNGRVKALVEKLGIRLIRYQDL